MTQIAIIDDHVLLGQVLANDLSKYGLRATVLSLGSDLVEQVRSEEVDLVLLDLELGPDLPNGVELIEPIQEMGVQVIVLSGVENPILLARCLELGATGILPKSMAFDALVSEITRSIESGEAAPSLARRLELLQMLSAHRRESQESLRPFEELSDREAEILVELMAGKSVGEISDSSYVAVSTVRSQVKSVLRKLDVTSQLQAVALAHQAGWPYSATGRERRRAS